jgi:UDP-N-acetylglucosamine:LPS N-acetylglucosamine transferase
MNSGTKKVLLIGAGGGHLTEGMLATEGVPMRRVIVTHRFPHTDVTLKSEKRYYVIDPHKSTWKYFINALQSLWIIIRERPHFIINTGGGISIACSLLGKAVGAKLIYIESGARISTPSRTGQFMYKYSDLFIVQWRPLLKHFPDAVYGGPLL